MATFDTQFGRFHVEKSKKESAVNLGFESEQGSGFMTVPFGKRELIHAASLIGAASLLRALSKKKRAVNRAQKDVQRRMKQARKSYGGKGGGKRG